MGASARKRRAGARPSCNAGTFHLRAVSRHQESPAAGLRRARQHTPVRYWAATFQAPQSASIQQRVNHHRPHCSGPSESSGAGSWAAGYGSANLNQRRQAEASDYPPVRMSRIIARFTEFRPGPAAVSVARALAHRRATNRRRRAKLVRQSRPWRLRRRASPATRGPTKGTPARRKHGGSARRQCSTKYRNNPPATRRTT